jgi:hypothetical protein
MKLRAGINPAPIKISRRQSRFRMDDGHYLVSEGSFKLMMQRKP